MAIGRGKGRNISTRSVRFLSDEIIEGILNDILADILAATERMKALGESYAREAALYKAQAAEYAARTAEREIRIAERDAQTAEREAKIQENEKAAAVHAAKTAEYQAQIDQLQQATSVTKSLGELSDAGTGFLKALTPLQMKFTELVDQRAEFTNTIFAKIKLCSTLLHEGRSDELEEQIALLQKDFLKLDQLVEAENQAQEDVVEVLDKYEGVVDQMASLLETLNHLPNYQKPLREKSHDIERRFYDDANAMFDANRPTKEGSDKLGQQCQEAFSLLKQRLQQKKPGSPASSRTSTPPRDPSPRSRTSSEESDSVEDFTLSSPCKAEGELKEQQKKSSTATVATQLGIQFMVAKPAAFSLPEQPLHPNRSGGQPAIPDLSYAAARHTQPSASASDVTDSVRASTSSMRAVAH